MYGLSPHCRKKRREDPVNYIPVPTPRLAERKSRRKCVREDKLKQIFQNVMDDIWQNKDSHVM
jgi:hypothetical protein